MATKKTGPTPKAKPGEATPSPHPTVGQSSSGAYVPGGGAQPGTTDQPSALDYSQDTGNQFTFYEHRQPKQPSSQFLRNADVTPGEFAPVETVFSTWLSQFVRLDPKAVEAYQDRLEAAGLIEHGKYQRGDPFDAATQGAITTVIHQASVAGISLDERLDRITQEHVKQPTPDSFRAAEEDALKRSYYAKYVDLWGTLPPPGVVESAIAHGQNVYDFEYAQRNLPSFQLSPTYQRERIGLESDLATRTGATGLGTVY